MYLKKTLKMKKKMTIKISNFLFLGLVFLMVGCKAIEAVSDGKPPIVTKTQVEKIPLNVIKTAKPILCVNSIEIFSHLQSIGEMPIATWTDETYGYPVIVFMNIEEGSSSVIEMPSVDKGLLKGLACIISSGVETVVNLTIKKDGGMAIRYLTF